MNERVKKLIVRHCKLCCLYGGTSRAEDRQTQPLPDNKGRLYYDIRGTYERPEQEAELEDAGHPAHCLGVNQSLQPSAPL